MSNWIPLQEPASGPNFWKFGDDVLYAIHIDNDGDAREDVSYYWRFQTSVKEPGTFLYNNNVVTVSTNGSGEAVDYPGLNVQQSYTLTEIRDGRKSTSRSGMLTPPVNVGIRSTNTAASYANLAAAANYTIGDTGIRVFAGQRDEAFAVDLGSIFDLGGLRPFNSLHLVPLTDAPGVNTTDGYNVHSIVIEIPVSRLTEGRRCSGDLDDRRAAEDPDLHRQRRFDACSTADPGFRCPAWGCPSSTRWSSLWARRIASTQATRVGTVSSSASCNDPELGKLIPFLYPGANITVPQAPRNDLVAIFLTGIPGVNQPDDVTPAEMLRINTSVPSGFPNGRPAAGRRGRRGSSGRGRGLL